MRTKVGLLRVVRGVGAEATTGGRAGRKVGGGGVGEGEVGDEVEGE